MCITFKSFKRIKQYNYFFKTKQMNFGTSILRTQYSPYVNTFPTQFVIPNQNYNILPKLRQALKLSVGRFTLYELEKKSKQAQKALIQKKSEQKKSVVIELLSSDEEKYDQNSKIENDVIQKVFTNQSQIKQLQEKTDHSKFDGQFQKEQDIDDQQPASNSIRKTLLIRKQKSVKMTHKIKKHRYQKIQKNLDLTDVAIIKNTPFSVQQLLRKKQALQMRIVQNWDQTAKGRTQRREIRMLKK